jgi:hypothetical protein
MIARRVARLLRAGRCARVVDRASVLKMRIQHQVRGYAALLLVAMCLRCGDDDGAKQPAGRGTPKCNEWQSAVCGWVARCQGPAILCDQVRSITCKSDSEAQRCASGLAAASCSEPPAQCDVGNIADPAPAKKACEDFLGAFCQRSEECQAGSRDTCLDQLKTTLDCSRAIGVNLAFDRCMTDIPKTTCAAMNLPPACQQVLLFQ